jgi:hypothetical protein
MYSPSLGTEYVSDWSTGSEPDISIWEKSGEDHSSCYRSRDEKQLIKIKAPRTVRYKR